MSELWRFELLGQMRATQGARRLTRFRTQKTGALLAYLAYFQDRAHPREVLIEWLWPDCNPTAGRHNLSMALSSLRNQLAAPGLDPLEQVHARLASQPALLLLDNFEQLAAEGRTIVQALLTQMPLLRCLVTSRVQLNLAGEQVWPVAPLPIPNGAVEPARLLQYPSVALFVDRAQAVRPDFQLTPRNAAAIAQLCKRLNGIPLAIELAAARAQVLTPAQMLERLKDRFELLVSRGRHEARHRTLRAALDWSYQMLAPALQRFFAQLSVFRGGWTLEAAEAVCGDPLGPLALDHLAELTECSLVLTDARGETMRFGLLEILREYAAEVLPPDDEAARRHAEYFLALAETAETKLTGPEQPLWLQRLGAEYDNLRAAFEWSQSAGGDPELGLRLAGALHLFLIVSAPLSEPLDWLLRALDAQTASPAARLKALAAAALVSAMKGEGARAIALSQKRIELCRAAGEAGGLAISLIHVGWTAYELDDFERAETYLLEGLAVARANSNLWGTAFALAGLTYANAAHGDYEVAARFAAEGLALQQKLGSPYGLAHHTRSPPDLPPKAWPCSKNSVRLTAWRINCAAWAGLPPGAVSLPTRLVISAPAFKRSAKCAIRAVSPKCWKTWLPFTPPLSRKRARPSTLVRPPPCARNKAPHSTQGSKPVKPNCSTACTNCWANPRSARLRRLGNGSSWNRPRKRSPSESPNRAAYNSQGHSEATAAADSARLAVRPSPLARCRVPS